MRAATVGAVIITAIVTAAVTSAVWLVIFNLSETERGDAPVIVNEVSATRPATQVTPPPRPAVTASDPADYRVLAAKRLTIPVSGMMATHLTDTFGDDRGGGARAHQALDIMAPRGTPVVATEDGRIEKLFTSDQGGLTVYQFDPTRTYSYYYAHLDRYADDLAEGQAVKRGQVIGYVGFTGNASPEGPHLHFGIYKLGPDKRWHEGVPLNPFPVLGGTAPASHTLPNRNE
ncbi:M23 family metallopeptidase [Sphingoaurantiacus capsulatus]|uniref:M23 family metallopeptidase n=1 Tax=Sphingoaurantiacus capsulatus TaxID=1771310 RepID=A0ABV7XE35_9SPHN